MKRLFFLFILCVALLASASERELQPVDGITLKAVDIGTDVAASIVDPAASKVAEAGYYFESDTSCARNKTFWCAKVTVDSVSATNFVIHNFYGQGMHMEATMTGSRTFAISPCVIATVGNANVYIYKAVKTATGWAYNKSANIDGVVHDNGDITIESCVICDPVNEKLYDILQGSRLCKSNAVAERTSIDNETSAVWMLVRQTGKYTAKLLNFTDKLDEYDVRLPGGDKVEIDPQRAYNYSILGAFYVYPTDFDHIPINKVGSFMQTMNAEGPIVGKVSGNTINIGNWGVLLHHADPKVMLEGYKSTTLSLDKDVLTLPEKSILTLNGEGTEEKPFTIATSQDLLALAETVNGGNVLQGKFVKLVSDLDLSDMPPIFRPIGTATSPFQGVFDGDNHVVNHFDYTTYDLKNTGIFGCVGSSGTIKNLNLNVKIYSDGVNAGAIAGSSDGVIENCTVGGSVISGNSRAGGIVGMLSKNAVVSGCEIKYGTIVAGACATGGVVGYQLGGTVKDCKVKGYVTHGDYVITKDNLGFGGIVGSSYTDQGISPAISNCCFAGQLFSKAERTVVGGIVGYAQGAVVDNCLSGGLLTTSASKMQGTSQSGETKMIDVGASGGLVGKSLDAQFSNCMSMSTILNGPNSGHLGGIVGYVDEYDSKSAFSACYAGVQIFNNEENPSMPVYGRCNRGNEPFKRTYYDVQATGLYGAPGGVQTSVLISGEPLEGFSPDFWVFRKGYYPVLKTFDNDRVSTFSSLPLVIGKGETARTIKSNFLLTSTSELKWSILNGANNGTQGHVLKIAGDSAIVTGCSGVDTLALSLPDSYVTRYMAINVIGSNPFEGNGTAENPYRIRTSSDMVTLAMQVNDLKMTYSGSYFLMTNDIDMRDVDFKGIGVRSGAVSTLVERKFGGVFDGNGHAIHNLNMNGIVLNGTSVNVSSSKQNVGLFVMCDKSSEIKNLTIGSDCAFSGYRFVGTVASFTQGSITNCRNYATVVASNSVAGGIVANIDGGTVSHCYNGATVSVGSQVAGGIAGSCINHSSIFMCQNDGDVSWNSSYGKSASAVGGIVGSTAGVIERCVNNGTITGTSIGGICGSGLNGVEINRSLNTGIVSPTTISQSTSLGPVIGVASKGQIMHYCYYDGQINAISTAKLYRGACSGLPTSVLISGDTIPGLDKASFDYSKGCYPVLKEFCQEKATGILRTLWILMDSVDNTQYLRHNASLSTPEGATWRVNSGYENFAIDNDVLKVTVPSDNVVYGSIAVEAKGVKKLINLRSVPALFDGEGTVEHPFLIKSTKDISTLRSAVNDMLIDFSGSHFKVTQDLDFKDYGNFVPIAKYDGNTASRCVFDGDFDGDGHTFSNVNAQGTAKMTRFGFFGIVGANGCVRNLAIKNSLFAAGSYVASIAGYVTGELKACVNEGTKIATLNAQGSKYAASLGGIAGYVDGIVDSCVNRGNVDVAVWSGGIASEAGDNAVISRCVNYQNVYTVNASVIAGVVARAGGVVKNCVNYGSIETKCSGSSIGGITALCIRSARISNCTNYGDVKALNSSMVGGVVGYQGSLQVTVDSCSNHGKVCGYSEVGGITGRLFRDGSIVNCTNYAVVEAVNNHLGGIAGYVDGQEGHPSVIEYCRNLGALSGSSKTMGGVVGSIVTKHALLSSCYNVAGVDASRASIAGGVAGKIACDIASCFNGGLVVAGDSTLVGGIAGNSESIVSDCYNLGTVSAAGDASGLIGRGDDGAMLQRCYNAGAINATGKAVITALAATDGFVASDVYYDSDASATTASGAAQAQPLDTRGLCSSKISDKFIIGDAAYPRLICWAADSLANFCAATALPAEGESLKNIVQPILLGAFEGTVWEAGKGLWIDNGKAYSTALGPATLTKRCGDFSQTLYVNVAGLSGICDTVVGKYPVETTYYNLNGQLIGNQSPSNHGVYIEVIQYSDKSVTNHKIVR